MYVAKDYDCCVLGLARRFWKADAGVGSGPGSTAGPILSQIGKTLSEHTLWFFCVPETLTDKEGAFRWHHEKLQLGASESKNALFLSGLVTASEVHPDADMSGTDQNQPRTTHWL